MMSTNAKIQAFLESAAEFPAKSKLEPYAEMIRTLRRKRWTYQRIAYALRSEFALPVSPSTIHNFVKVRAKRRRQTPDDDASTSKQQTRHTPKPRPAERPRFNIDA